MEWFPATSKIMLWLKKKIMTGKENCFNLEDWVHNKTILKCFLYWRIMSVNLEQKTKLTQVELD